MTDRRRNAPHPAARRRPARRFGLRRLDKETRLGLDLRGGVELVYQAKPTPQQPTVTQEALDRSIDIMRERVDQLGVAEPEIQRSGGDQISVGLPNVQDAERAAQQIGKTAQMYFYDWERTSSARGRANPAVTGGTEARRSRYYDAVKRRSSARRSEDGNNKPTGRSGTCSTRSPSRRAAGRRTQATGGVAGNRRARAPWSSPDGSWSAEAEQSDNAGPQPRPLLSPRSDDPALSGNDIKNPAADFDRRRRSRSSSSTSANKGHEAFQASPGRSRSAGRPAGGTRSRRSSTSRWRSTTS